LLLILRRDCLVRGRSGLPTLARGTLCRAVRGAVRAASGRLFRRRLRSAA